MTVTLRLTVNRQRLRHATVLGVAAALLLGGAALVRPTPPRAFDFDEFERERLVSRLQAQRGTHTEVSDSRGKAAPQEDLEGDIKGTLVVYGTAEGTRQ